MQSVTQKTVQCCCSQAFKMGSICRLEGLQHHTKKFKLLGNRGTKGVKWQWQHQKAFENGRTHTLENAATHVIFKNILPSSKLRLAMSYQTFVVIGIVK